MLDTNKRFYEIDAARSIVMFVAVFIHTLGVYSTYDTARTVNEDRYFFFEWLQLGLNLFAASPTFMIVGGFFCIFLMSRYSFKTFLVKRTARLLLPLISCGLTFGLLETYLRYSDQVGDATLGIIEYLNSPAFSVDLLSGGWLHQTWFLVDLIFAVIVLSTLCWVLGKAGVKPVWLIKSASWVAELFEKLPLSLGWLVALLTLGQLGMLKVAALTVSEVYTPIQLGPIGIVSAYNLAEYSAYFLFGALIFCVPKLYDLTMRWSWILVVVSILAIGFGAFVHPSNISETGFMGNVYYILFLVFRWITSIMFLQLMHRYFSHKPQPIMQVLTDAAMTVYLVHHLLVYIIGSLFVGILWSAWIEILLIFIAAASLSILFHYGVIAQLGALRLLFNGQAKGPKFGLREYLELGRR